MDSENIQPLSSSSSSNSSCQLSPCSARQNLNPPLISQAPCISSQKRIKFGRKKFKVTRYPLYKGVRQRNGKNWVSEVCTGQKSKSRIWLGTYAAPEMAARAYDAAALAIRGTMAVLNFPDSAWLVPRARSSSPRDIQEAAFMAAEAFRPGAVSSSSCSSNTTDLLPNKTKHKVLETSKRENKDQKVLEPLSLEIISANKSSSDDDEEVPNQYSTFFFDEEALFNMPGLLDSMAEGLILTPPAIGRGFDWDDHDFACDMDLTLWSD
ncbi:hypothetical protein F2P56_033109 [Juglans regia]|uniref:Dehydration-responsive element-binding protein 1F-like n=2 Tax=Juglans regia TaxID=51240 RepID=A0A2I4FNB0_JUGRE|nr:dehydration-responsive element-binding protein 1F-like [Juglans regia]KAF5447565.1 hypothetical protein F2P56_033109 [Juglans regia]